MAVFFKALVRRAKQTYYSARNSQPIWFFLNRKPRRAWEDLNIKLSDKENLIADTLKRDGIAASSLSDFFEEKFIGELRRAADYYKNNPNVPEVDRSHIKGTNKTFLKKLWGYYDVVVSEKDFRENLFLRLALSESVLKIAGEYFGGMAPRFYHFDLQETIVVPPAEAPKLSQRWHRDPEDKKMCKVFVYFSDVEEEGAGPFKYVLGSQSGGRWSKFFPQRPPAGVYPPEGAVEKKVPTGEILTCFGKTGAMIFCDTAGLHKGGFSTTRPRLMLTLTFVSFASPHERYFTLPGSIHNVNLKDLARFVLN